MQSGGRAKYPTLGNFQETFDDSVAAKLLSNVWGRSWMLVGFVCAAYDRSQHQFRVFAATEMSIRVSCQNLNKQKITNAILENQVTLPLSFLVIFC